MWGGGIEQGDRWVWGGGIEQGDRWVWDEGWNKGIGVNDFYCYCLSPSHCTFLSWILQWYHPSDW